MTKRTTLTLDDDVAAKLDERARATGRSFKEVVNESLRRGLAAESAAPKLPPFRIRARALGARPGIQLDSISQLLEQVEGPRHR